MGSSYYADLRVGLIVIFAILVVGVGIFVWVYRDKWTDIRNLITLVLLLALLPLGAMMVQQRTNLFSQASSDVEIASVDVNKQADKVVVYLTLTDSVVAYMEYTPAGSSNKTVIIPVGPVEKRIGHAFEFDPGKSGGKAKFFVNGREMLWRGGGVDIPGL